MSAGLVGWIEDQVARFRKHSEYLARYGAQEAATALERAAEDLEAAFRRFWLEELPVTAAAEEAGYTPAHLRELVHAGKVLGQQDGAFGLIKVRRCDLPRKPRTAPPSLKAVATRLGIK
jgi:hypothetical protein